MNTSHNFIFKSTEKVILGKKMSLTENIVGCNLELPDQHVFEGDKLYHLFSPYHGCEADVLYFCR